MFRPTSIDRNWHTHGLVALITFFAAVAMAYVYQGFSVVGTDGVFYAEMARSLTEGNGLSVYGVPHTIFSPLLPISIAPFYAIGIPLETAAHIPIALFALASIIGIYVLGKKMYSEAAGVLSALFLATNGVYIWAASVPTTPQYLAGFFTLVALLSLLGIEKVEKKEVFVKCISAGVFIGLAYLARPEYFLLIFPVIAYVFVVSWRDARGARQATIRSIILSAAFFITCLSYLIYLHNELGYWTISGRGSELALIVTSENMEMAGVASEAGTPTVVAPPPQKESSIVLALRELPSLLKRLADGLVNTEHTLLRIFGLIGTLFFVLGLRFFVITKKLRELALFAAFLSPIVLIAFAQGGTPNYLVQYFYLFIPIIAIGLIDGIREVEEKYFLKEHVHNFIFGILVMALSAYFILPAVQNVLFLPDDYRDMEYRQLGLWMHANIPGIEEEVIVSRKPEPTFYAESLWAIVPYSKNTSELHAVMQERKQRYLIVDERSFPLARPELVDMLEPEKVSQFFTLVYQTEYYGQKAFLYRITED